MQTKILKIIALRNMKKNHGNINDKHPLISVPTEGALEDGDKAIENYFQGQTEGY